MATSAIFYTNEQFTDGCNLKPEQIILCSAYISFCLLVLNHDSE